MLSRLQHCAARASCSEGLKLLAQAVLHGPTTNNQETKMQARANKSWIAVGLAALVTAGGTQAAGYPERTVTMIVPAAAGGTTDLAARMAAQALAPVMGQSVVVDNVGGAGSTIATDLRADRDRQAEKSMLGRRLASLPALGP